MISLFGLSGEEYRVLFDYAQDAIFVLDEDGWLLRANLRAYEMLKFSREELLALRIQDLASDGSALVQIWSVEQDGFRTFETALRDKNGNLIPVEIGVSMITYSNERVVLAIVRDTSRRKRAEEEILRWNRELMRLTATTTALIKINHLISSSLDMNQVWEAFAHEVQKLIPLDRIGVILLRENGMLEVLTFAGKWKARPNILMSLTTGSAVDWVLHHRVPHIERDLEAAQAFTEDDWLFREGIRSVIRLPIFARGKMVGMLFLDSRQSGAYSEHDLTMLEPIAVQLAITLENQRLYREVQEQVRRARVLYELTAAFNSTLDPEEILRVLVDKTVQALQVPYCQAGLVEEETVRLTISHGLPETAGQSVLFIASEGVMSRLWQAQEIRVVRDLRTYPISKYRELAVSLGLCSMISVPMILSGEVLGILNAYTSKVREFTPDETALMGAFVSQAAVAVHNARNFQAIKRAKEQIELMSQRDFLTGLYNRQFFENLYRKEIERAIRYNRPVSVAMIDLDDLKVINDTYGHQMGDAVLAAVGKLVRQTLRQVDLAGRYGGDEIIIAFPETEPEEARRATERMREALERLNGEERFPFSVRLSIGLGYACGDYSSLLQDADAEMYREKQTKERKARAGMQKKTSLVTTEPEVN